jgi:hypothetical protein
VAESFQSELIPAETAPVEVSATADSEPVGTEPVHDISEAEKEAS